MASSSNSDSIKTEATLQAAVEYAMSQPQPWAAYYGYLIDHHPNVRAALALIRDMEGTSKKGMDPYRVGFGHDYIADLSRHPNKSYRFLTKSGKEQRTTAAGAYQFLNSVWREMAAITGLHDFSPRSQDINAVARIHWRGALEPLLKGDIRTFANKAGAEWASFPTAPESYDQPKHSWRSFERAWNRARYDQIGQPTPTPRPQSQAEALQELSRSLSEAGLLGLDGRLAIEHGVPPFERGVERSAERWRAAQPTDPEAIDLPSAEIPVPTPRPSEPTLDDIPIPTPRPQRFGGMRDAGYFGRAYASRDDLVGPEGGVHRAALAGMKPAPIGSLAPEGGMHRVALAGIEPAVGSAQRSALPPEGGWHRAMLAGIPPATMPDQALRTGIDPAVASRIAEVYSPEVVAQRIVAARAGHAQQGSAPIDPATARIGRAFAVAGAPQALNPGAPAAIERLRAEYAARTAPSVPSARTTATTSRLPAATTGSMKDSAMPYTGSARVPPPRASGALGALERLAANPLSLGPGGRTPSGLSAISAVMSGRAPVGAVAFSRSNPGFSVMGLPSGNVARTSSKYGWTEVYSPADDDVLGMHYGKVIAVDPTGTRHKAVTPDEAKGLAAKGWAISSMPHAGFSRAPAPGTAVPGFLSSLFGGSKSSAGREIGGLGGFLSGLFGGSRGPAGKSLGQQALGQAIGLAAGMFGPAGGIGGLGAGFSGGGGGLGGGGPTGGGMGGLGENYGGL